MDKAQVVTEYFEKRGYTAPTQQSVIDVCYQALQQGDCLHLADWDHYTTDGPLGDAYYCTECKQLAQVG